MLLSSFEKPLNDQKQKLCGLGTKLNKLEEQFDYVKQCLCYTPTLEQDLLVGKVFDVIGRFAQQLAAIEPPKQHQIPSEAKRRLDSLADDVDKDDDSPRSPW